MSFGLETLGKENFGCRRVNMGFISAISMAHRLMKERIRNGDTTIDATAGGGVDTLMLAELAGDKGKVYAFDIQQEALDMTRMRISRAKEQNNKLAEVHYILDSHHQLAKYVHSPVKAIMFNLGYFPSGDHAIITKTQTTLMALDAALTHLTVGGIITCMLYPGHAGGDEEAAAVTAWASELETEKAQVIIYRQLQRSSAPYLIAIEKKS